MAYAISGLKVVNPRIGYLAPIEAIPSPRIPEAISPDFKRNGITMPLYGPSLRSNYGSRGSLGLAHQGAADYGTTYGSQPSSYGVASVGGFEMPEWLKDAAGYVRQIADQITGAGENPATPDAPENTEMEDIGTPVGGGLFGMDSKTLLLLAAAGIGIWFLAKKG